MRQPDPRDSRPTVLLVSLPFPPVFQVGAFRTIRFTKYLPELGWRPVVLTIRPQSRRRSLAVDPSLEVPAGVDIYRTPVWRPCDWLFSLLDRTFRHQVVGRRSELSRATSDERGGQGGILAASRARLSSLRDLVCATPDNEIGWLVPAVWKGYQLIRRGGAQVLYTTGPPHSSHLIGVVLKRLSGLPFVMDLRDPWADAPWAANTPSTLRSRLNRRFERLSVHAADRVLLNTDELRDDFRARYNDTAREHFVSLPNGFDPEFRKRVERYIAEAPKRKEPIVELLHAGSVYGQRDLRPLLRAIADSPGSGERIVVNQIGEVEDADGLRAYAAETGVASQLVMKDHLEHDKVLEKMARADILVVLQAGTHLQVPSKIFEMILFRKPILAIADEGATASVVRGYGLGAVAAPSDPAAIGRAIEKLRRFVGAEDSWSRAASDFDGKHLTSRLARALGQVCKLSSKPVE